eukprot:243328-Pelagomonas_calceolata.AAC.1
MHTAWSCAHDAGLAWKAMRVVSVCVPYDSVACMQQCDQWPVCIPGAVAVCAGACTADEV